MTCSPLLLLLLQEQVAQGYLPAIQALCEFDYVRDNPLLRQFQLAYRLLTPAASYRSAVFTFLRLVSGRDEVSPSRYRGVSVRRRGSRGPDRFSGHAATALVAHAHGVLTKLGAQLAALQVS